MIVKAAVWNPEQEDSNAGVKNGSVVFGITLRGNRQCLCIFNKTNQYLICACYVGRFLVFYQSITVLGGANNNMNTYLFEDQAPYAMGEKYDWSVQVCVVAFPASHIYRVQELARKFAQRVCRSAVLKHGVISVSETPDRWYV